MRSERATRKCRISLVQQGVWAMQMESMPLAMGYLKAVLDTDPRTRDETNSTIYNFDGGHTLTMMANRLFNDDVPDILAFSVFGWNVRNFGMLAETFKQLNPEGIVVFGGTHVANQSERILRMYPDVDVVVNGEGEFTFCDLTYSYMSGEELNTIEGISFRGADDVIRTTKDVQRISDLDIIPSPFLTDSIKMNFPSGEFRYDVALMETNRGCPYHCAFCYWGGAVGQKVRAFSRGRLTEELEYFAFHKVETVVLCDANFGLLRDDEQFVEDIIKIREKYGYPRAIETSWAKNKSTTFYNIVRRMKESGLRSSFTLALQTLDDATLTGMNRKNMKVNAWKDLVEWLAEEKLDCYAELIWGAPGETVDSFLKGYDELAIMVPRIATYPLLLLPNTDYADKKSHYGFITVRGDNDDFEYVLAHNTMSMQDNRQMQQFLFWARTVGENMIFRNIWNPVRELAGITQSQLILLLKDWFNQCDHPASGPLRTNNLDLVDANVVATTIEYLYAQHEVEMLLTAWWDEAVAPRVPAAVREYVTDIFRFDLLTRPLYDGDPARTANLIQEEIHGVRYYVQQSPELRYDVPAAIARGRTAGEWSPEEPKKWSAKIYHKIGFKNHLDSHEVAAQYIGRLFP